MDLILDKSGRSSADPVSRDRVKNVVGSSALTARFPALTGFRGLCILWVVLVHLPVHMPELLDNFRERWGIGVDFFLAISGFLVTRSILSCDLSARLRGLTGKAALWRTAREFVVRRASRILAPYLLALACIGIVGFALDAGLKSKLVAVSAMLPSYLVFLQNYFTPHYINEAPVILNTYWSLAFQEQFYIVLLLFYVLASGNKRGLGTILLSAGLVSAALRFALVLGWWGGGSHTAELLMWTPIRFDAISWSCLAWIYYDELAALWSTPRRAYWINLLTFGLLASILAAHSLFPGDFAQSVIYCIKGPTLALVVRALCANDVESGVLRGTVGPGLFIRAMRQRWLGKVGMFAYEIYLFNVLVIAVAAKVVNPKTSPALFTGLVYGGVLVAGYALYEAFSRPVQGWVKRWGI